VREQESLYGRLLQKMPGDAGRGAGRRAA
jgi:hypothetical protein